MGTTARAAAWGMVLAVVTAGHLAGTAAAGHADEVRDGQWHLAELGVAEAHRHSLGEGVTVAVLDSGVDASHPDLRDNVLPGVDLTGRGTDGRDDPAGTGTALAGLVAGHGHDAAATAGPPAGPPTGPPTGTAEPAPGSSPRPTAEGSPPPVPPLAPDGVLGLAPAATVLPVVVAAPGAAPAARTLAAGIDEAVRRGAQVICIGRPVPDDPAVSRAVGAAVAAGVVVLLPGAPAGDALARYGGAGVLGALPAGVSAAAPLGTVVAVPGSGVLSTGGQGGYYRYARTSGAAATAVLAGAVALVRAAHPDLTPYELTHRMLATADGGALDLLAALTGTVGSPPGRPPVPPPTGTPGPPPQTPTPDPATQVAAFDSEDWRRWLVAVPLLAFLVILVAVSAAAARRARRSTR